MEWEQARAALEKWITDNQQGPGSGFSGLPTRIDPYAVVAALERVDELENAPTPISKKRGKKAKEEDDDGASTP